MLDITVDFDEVYEAIEGFVGEAQRKAYDVIENLGYLFHDFADFAEDYIESISE